MIEKASRLGVVWEQAQQHVPASLHERIEPIVNRALIAQLTGSAHHAALLSLAQGESVNILPGLLDDAGLESAALGAWRARATSGDGFVVCSGTVGQTEIRHVDAIQIAADDRQLRVAVSGVVGNRRAQPPRRYGMDYSLPANTSAFYAPEAAPFAWRQAEQALDAYSGVGRRFLFGWLRRQKYASHTEEWLDLAAKKVEGATDRVTGASRVVGHVIATGLQNAGIEAESLDPDRGRNASVRFLVRAALRATAEDTMVA